MNPDIPSPPPDMIGGTVKGLSDFMKAVGEYISNIPGFIQVTKKTVVACVVLVLILAACYAAYMLYMHYRPRWFSTSRYLDLGAEDATLQEMVSPHIANILCGYPVEYLRGENAASTDQVVTSEPEFAANTKRILNKVNSYQNERIYMELVVRVSAQTGGWLDSFKDKLNDFIKKKVDRATKTPLVVDEAQPTFQEVQDIWKVGTPFQQVLATLVGGYSEQEKKYIATMSESLETATFTIYLIYVKAKYRYDDSRNRDYEALVANPKTLTTFVRNLLKNRDPGLVKLLIKRQKEFITLAQKETDNFASLFAFVGESPKIQNMVLLRKYGGFFVDSSLSHKVGGGQGDDEQKRFLQMNVSTTKADRDEAWRVFHNGISTKMRLFKDFTKLVCSRLSVPYKIWELYINPKATVVQLSDIEKIKKELPQLRKDPSNTIRVRQLEDSVAQLQSRWEEQNNTNIANVKLGSLSIKDANALQSRMRRPLSIEKAEDNETVLRIFRDLKEWYDTLGALSTTLAERKPNASLKDPLLKATSGLERVCRHGVDLDGNGSTPIFDIKLSDYNNSLVSDVMMSSWMEWMDMYYFLHNEEKIQLAMYIALYWFYYDGVSNTNTFTRNVSRLHEQAVCFHPCAVYGQHEELVMDYRLARSTMVHEIWNNFQVNVLQKYTDLYIYEKIVKMWMVVGDFKEFDTRVRCQWHSLRTLANNPRTFSKYLPAEPVPPTPAMCKTKPVSKSPSKSAKQSVVEGFDTKEEKVVPTEPVREGFLGGIIKVFTMLPRLIISMFELIPQIFSLIGPLINIIVEMVKIVPIVVELLVLFFTKPFEALIQLINVVLFFICKILMIVLDIKFMGYSLGELILMLFNIIVYRVSISALLTVIYVFIYVILLFLGILPVGIDYIFFLTMGTKNANVTRMFYRYIFANEKSVQDWWSMGGQFGGNGIDKTLMVQKQCAPGFLPALGGTTCTSHADYLPRYCPQTLLMKMALGLGIDGPVTIDRNTTPTGFFGLWELSQSEKEKLVDEMMDTKKKYVKECSLKMEGLPNEIGKSVCAHLDYYSTNRKTKENLTKVCEMTYCRNGNTEPFCHRFNNGMNVDINAANAEEKKAPESALIQTAKYGTGAITLMIVLWVLVERGFLRQVYLKR
jgi:hypothetical protein